MAYAYPFFKWYPADAEMDEAYSSLNDTELGFFHRCLNRAWPNYGIPSNLDDLAATMRVTREYLDTVWPKVSRCFVLTETVHPRYINPRQEREREEAIAKTKKCSDAIRTRYERSTDEVRPNNGRSTDESPRASDSDSSSASSEKGSAEGKNGDAQFALVELPPNSQSHWFASWWNAYWLHKAKKDAETAFLKAVKTQEIFDAVMSATRSQSAEMLARAPDKRPHGATWLNGRRWEDDVLPISSPFSRQERSFEASVARVIGPQLAKGEKPW